MEFSTIRYQVEEGIARLVLNRPEVANGFNIPMCEEILQAIDLAAKDETVFLLQLEAEGAIFSVGGDLVEMKRAVDEDDIPSLVKIAELVNEISFAIKQLPKVVLMVTNGAVAGAAANMAVAADFVIASDKTKFIQAFVGGGLSTRCRRNVPFDPLHRSQPGDPVGYDGRGAFGRKSLGLRHCL